MAVQIVFASQTIKWSTKTKERMTMEDKILREAERVCEIMFPENEEQQCLLHHHLALFADFVEVIAIKRFRDEMSTESYPNYLPEEIKHG
jgi:hypothetical protein